MRNLASVLAGRCAVVQVNTQESPGLAGRFDIRGIPAVLFLRRGKMIDSISGALDKEALLAWCRRHLA